MKKWLLFMAVVTLAVLLAGCGGEGKAPARLEVPLEAQKGFEGASGTAVIEDGTKVTIKAAGLDPNEVYTAFFVNVKSQMSQGVGKEPFVLPVAADGSVDFTANIPKDSYKRFIQFGIYVNPDGEPHAHPLGLKAKFTIGGEKPKPVLMGPLR